MTDVKLLDARFGAQSRIPHLCKTSVPLLGIKPQGTQRYLDCLGSEDQYGPDTMPYRGPSHVSRPNKATDHTLKSPKQPPKHATLDSSSLVPMDIPHVQMSELCASKTYSACLTIQQTGPVLVSASSKNEACATAKDVLTPESVGKRIQSTKRSLFDNAVKKALDTITDYLKVAVLVLRWDEGVDEFASGHTREVNAQRSQFQFGGMRGELPWYYAVCMKCTALYSVRMDLSFALI